MKRLLQIEWLKLRHYFPFRILTLLYALLVLIVCGGVRFFLAWLRDRGVDFDGINPTIIPFYDFPDVWQNITYLATFFKLFLAFIIIISVANEVSYRTLRQNIIDGMSKREWLLSKMLLIMALATFGTLLLFLVGTVMGLLFSHPDGLPYYFHNFSFLFAYWLEVVTFLTLAMLLILIIRRSGFVIVGLIMYTLAFEPALTAIMEYGLPNSQYAELGKITAAIAPFLPIRALNGLIHVPFQRYFFQEIQDYISLKETLIVLGWLAFAVWACYFILRRRDL